MHLDELLYSQYTSQGGGDVSTPFQVYQKVSVTSASERTIVVRLHEKMLRELSLAWQAWQDGSIQTMRESVVKIQDIVAFLRGSIDTREKSADTLASLYAYYLVRLAELYMEPEGGHFQELRRHFTEWKETWERVLA